MSPTKWRNRQAKKLIKTKSIYLIITRDDGQVIFKLFDLYIYIKKIDKIWY